MHEGTLWLPVYTHTHTHTDTLGFSNSTVYVHLRLKPTQFTLLLTKMGILTYFCVYFTVYNNLWKITQLGSRELFEKCLYVHALGVNKNSVINYSPSCLSKPVRFFWWNVVLTTFLCLGTFQLHCCLRRVRKLSDFIKNISICGPKMNKGLTGVELHNILVKLIHYLTMINVFLQNLLIS